MKKVFKIIAISLVSIFIIVFIGVFIFIKTFDLNRFKPQIISAAQSALGRKVDFLKIGLVLNFSGIQLGLSDITIGDNPDFGKENFLSVKEVKLGVSLKELIFKRQIQVLGVVCSSLQVNIIRLKDGRINIQALGTKTPTASEPVKTEVSSVQKAAIGLPAIMINRISVTDGRINYIDYSFDSKFALAIDKIAVSITNFSFKNPFQVFVSANFLNNGSQVPLKAQGQVSINESEIAVTDMSLVLGKGKADFSGRIKDYMSSQNYSAKVKASEIDIAEWLDQSASPVKIEGRVFGDLELIGQGQNLSGEGSAQIKEGRLVNINVLRTVLDKLAIIPNLAAEIETSLPDRYKENLNAKDTVISSCNAAFGVNSGSVVIKSMDLATEAFKFQGSGVAGFDQSYSFDGAFTIPEDLSAMMIKAVKEMGYLLDEEKQIRFPLKVSGKGSSVSFMPDIKQMGITAIMNQGRQELEKVFDKAIGGKDSSQSGTTEPGASDQKSDKQELIDSVIGTIFGGKEKE